MADTITLTAEQADWLAQETAFAASNPGKDIYEAFGDVDAVLAAYDTAAPYVELLRDMRRDLATSQLDAARRVVEAERVGLLETLAEYEATRAEVQGEGRPTDWVEKDIASVTRRLAIANAILERLPAPVGA